MAPGVRVSRVHGLDAERARAPGEGRRDSNPLENWSHARALFAQNHRKEGMRRRPRGPLSPAEKQRFLSALETGLSARGSAKKAGRSHGVFYKARINDAGFGLAWKRAERAGAAANRAAIQASSDPSGCVCSIGE